MTINIPSLFSVLILLAFERLKKRIISEYIYIIISITITSVILLNWNRWNEGTKNVFPIFEESSLVLFSICVVSHLIPLIIVKLTKNRFLPSQE
ncbi:hypothetical protein [Winogradskyella immobilis]|uniref:Lycopene cyclase domain-containing protein n=1 Tax=Winogradskyella immobilis TaxID=2816852 RepID=A0ABS8ELU2_9FLAO|nr:hypothetical protein [Winogradskyella immobilis]MCC1484065.1 hypothetical protein [Winogradskyella immobilis]MCG0016157.1 hypothetical protein [Winogradskyella immobilis]